MALRRSQGRCAHLVARKFFVSKTFKVTAILGIASIAYDFQTGCQKKIVRVPVGFTHTHSSPFRNAVAFVSICVASWKLMTSLSANALMTPVQLCLVRAGFARSLSGRCAGLVVRDFSGLGSCSPAIIFIAGEQALF